ncbi:MAG: polyphosphate polymerase domain-containing protein [candidate division Zixibacteria bacterium]|nr:polyphosphate polymerase domain-containing protein [candidate division Zixibacteria bacterium]
MDQLYTLLNGLYHFPIEQMAKYSLLRRVDTKFLYPASKLGTLIKLLGEYYGILPASEQPIASYQTLYFDSPDKIFYYQHHRGKRDRFKIRIRHYLDRKLTFMEVKCKTNHNITNKVRRKLDYLNNSINGDEQSFLRDQMPYDPTTIVSQVWTNFYRITLVGLGFKERLTVDLGLTFEADDKQHSMQELAIIEIKQPRFWSRSPAMIALRTLGVRPSSMSKYCTAQATLFPSLRSNRFHPSLRDIRRIINV